MNQQIPDLRTALETLQRGLDADKSDLVVVKNDDKRVDPQLLLLGRVSEPRSTR